MKRPGHLFVGAVSFAGWLTAGLLVVLVAMAPSFVPTSDSEISIFFPILAGAVAVGPVIGSTASGLVISGAFRRAGGTRAHAMRAATLGAGGAGVVFSVIACCFAAASWGPTGVRFLAAGLVLCVGVGMTAAALTPLWAFRTSRLRLPPAVPGQEPLRPDSQQPAPRAAWPAQRTDSPYGSTEEGP